MSRNLIRSFTAPWDPRGRLYAADDVEALVRRRRLRRPAVATATALDWGLPVLETHLTLIADGHLFYRDRDAIAFAATATLEEAAGLLIGQPLPGAGDAPDLDRLPLGPPAGTQDFVMVLGYSDPR